MTRLGGHSLAKYATGTLIGTSEGRGWNGLLAERWRNPEGDLGEVEVRDTEVIVMIDGNLPISRRGDGKLEHCHAVPGTVWLCPNGVHEDMVHLYGDVRESIHLFLPASPLSRTAIEDMGIDPDKVELCYEGGFRDPLIEGVARAVRAEMRDPAPAGKMLSETLAVALGAYILRYHSNLRPASVPLPSARGALDSRRLRRVTDFMEAHLADGLTIERLASEACLSPFHFARAFKAATGTAPHRYFTNRRIARARALIAEGKLSIAEVAAQCGFLSETHFVRWFKRSTGATPSEYRSDGDSADRTSRPREGRRRWDKSDFRIERRNDVLSVRLYGRLDTAAADMFAMALRDATVATDKAVILDFGEVSYIASAGLRSVLMAARNLGRQEARLVLCAVSDPVRQAFAARGFDRVLPIHKTMAEALASLEGRSGGGDEARRDIRATAPPGP